MKLAYHCWTSMHSDLATDIKAAAGAGYGALELGYSKIDESRRGEPIWGIPVYLVRGLFFS